MALVSHKHKWIFFHLYKCGGNSLRVVLKENFDGCEEMYGVHCLPKDLKVHFDKNIGKGAWESYYKFSIVRNPFDLLVSHLFYCKRAQTHGWHDIIIKEKMDSDFMNGFTKLYFKTLEEHKIPENRPVGSNKVVTLLQYLTDEKGKILVDFVGKLEQINECQKTIFAKLNLPPQAIPRINISGNRERNYRQYYNDTSQKLVEKHFEKDLKHFNYEF